jgi:hypothetical protein
MKNFLNKIFSFFKSFIKATVFFVVWAVIIGVSLFCWFSIYDSAVASLVADQCPLYLAKFLSFIFASVFTPFIGFLCWCVFQPENHEPISN